MTVPITVHSHRNGRERPSPCRFPFLVLVAALVLAGTCAAAGAAVFEKRVFADELTRVRYLDIIDELRCVVCQNQNIADSDADLAADLRGKVYELLMAGRSDTEIMGFMVERYGEFVLYRPPLTAVTLGLWVGPGLMLALGLWLLWRDLRSRRVAAGPLDPADRRRLNALLQDQDGAPRDPAMPGDVTGTDSR